MSFGVGKWNGMEWGRHVMSGPHLEIRSRNEIRKSWSRNEKDKIGETKMK